MYLFFARHTIPKQRNILLGIHMNDPIRVFISSWWIYLCHDDDAVIKRSSCVYRYSRHINIPTHLHCTSSRVCGYVPPEQKHTSTEQMILKNYACGFQLSALQNNILEIIQEGGLLFSTDFGRTFQWKITTTCMIGSVSSSGAIFTALLLLEM